RNTMISPGAAPGLDPPLPGTSGGQPPPSRRLRNLLHGVTVGKRKFTKTQSEKPHLRQAFRFLVFLFAFLFRIGLPTLPISPSMEIWNRLRHRETVAENIRKDIQSNFRKSYWRVLM